MKQTQNKDTGTYGGNLDDTKELRIDGYNYQLRELEITNWISQYGEIRSELEEIAISGETDRSAVGTGC